MVDLWFRAEGASPANLSHTLLSCESRPTFGSPGPSATLDQVLNGSEEENPPTVSTTESTSLLSIHPNPVQLVKFIKSVERKDVSGALFVRCLNAYAGGNEDPRRRVCSIHPCAREIDVFLV